MVSRDTFIHCADAGVTRIVYWECILARDGQDEQIPILIRSSYLRLEAFGKEARVFYMERIAYPIALASCAPRKGRRYEVWITR